MNYPAAEQRGIGCHAGLDPASSLAFWIPACAGMTLYRKRMGYLKHNKFGSVKKLHYSIFYIYPPLVWRIRFFFT